MRDINEFNVMRLFRFVFYTMAGITLYLGGVELDSINLKLAAIFLGIGALIGVVRNVMRYWNK